MDREDAESLGEAFLALMEHVMAAPGQRVSEVQLSQLGMARSPATRRRLVIAATFTAEPVQPIITYWLHRVGLVSEIELAPFNQVFQELLRRDGVIARNRLGINVLLIRAEDWKDPSATGELVHLLDAHAARSSAETIVIVCPPSARYRSDGRSSRFEQFESEVATVAESSSSIHFISWQTILSLYPVDIIDDSESDEYAKAPYSPEFNIALGTAIARKAHSVVTPAPKVLVLDCDNTLWRGIVGEDGPHGIVIDAGHAKLQRFAIQQLEAGVLLCLVSKNNEADVWEAFENAAGMLLKREMIVSYRINWQPKSENIRSLANELNLGIDSFVFIDDSAAECAEVSHACPQVLVLQLPSMTEEIARFVDHIWPLDSRKVTEADRKRAAMYTANAQREELRGNASSLAKFIESLEVSATFVPFSREIVARISQLTQRTNQFNTTTLRCAESDVRSFLEGGAELLVVDVSDRFGDYGIVGLVIYHCDAEDLSVELFLLSCRALSRGVEHEILSELGRIAKNKRARFISIAYRRTAKNKPVHFFLETVAGEHRIVVEPDERYIYRIPVSEALVATKYIAAVDVNEPISTRAPSKRAGQNRPRHAFHAWGEIATALSSVSRIRDAVDSSLVRERALPGGYVSTSQRPGSIDTGDLVCGALDSPDWRD